MAASEEVTKMVTRLCGKMLYALPAVALTLAAGTNVWGQEVTASITGTVTDPSGSPVAGASEGL